MPPGMWKARAGVALRLLASIACGGTATPPAPARQTPSPSVSPTLRSAGSITASISGLGKLQASDYFGIAADDSDVWVYNGDTGVLSKIAMGTNRVDLTVNLPPGCAQGAGCGNVAVDGTNVWVANVRDNTVTRVDAKTGAVVATVQLGAGAAPQVFVADAQVWSANYNTDSFSRIDPARNQVAKTIANHTGAESVTFAAGSLWFCAAGSTPALERLDPNTDAVQATVDLTWSGVPYGCFDAAGGSGRLVLAGVTETSSSIESVDLGTNKVTAASPPPGRKGVERGIASDGGNIWTIDSDQGLFQLNPSTGAPVASLQLSSAAGVTFGGGAVWVASAEGTLYRIAPGGNS